jgi:hypothetical protein
VGVVDEDAAWRWSDGVDEADTLGDRNAVDDEPAVAPPVSEGVSGGREGRGEGSG